MDGSQNSHDAFEEAIRNIRNPKEDELYLITVAERSPFSIGPMKEWNSRMEQVTRGYLSSYNNLAKERGLHPHCILGKAGNAGELICQAVDKKLIDFLFIGRRGTGWNKRLLAGSVSRYLMEHANCNVVVVKGSFSPDQRQAMNEQLNKQILCTNKPSEPLEHVEVLGEQPETSEQQTTPSVIPTYEGQKPTKKEAQQHLEEAETGTKAGDKGKTNVHVPTEAPTFI